MFKSKTTVVESNVELNKVYTDEVTGFTGTCSGIMLTIRGGIRVGLQPKVGADHKLIDAEWFDEGTIKGVTPVKDGGEVKTSFTTYVILGKAYTCKTTGFVGTATYIVKFQHGCLRVSLIPKVDNEGKLQEGCDVDEVELEGVKSYVKEPGGPVTKTMKTN